MRTKIPIKILNPLTGLPVENAAVEIVKREDGTPVTVFADWPMDVVDQLNQPISSDASGRVAGWVARGAYTALVTPPGFPEYSEHFDSTPGADGSLDVSWIPNASIPDAKLATPAVGLQPVVHGDYQTAVLAVNVNESGHIPMAKGYRVRRLTTDHPARVRLYTSDAKRDADVNRPVTVDPPDYPTPDANPDHGCAFEAVTDATHLDISTLPTPSGFESSGSDNIPVTIQNVGAAPFAITVSIYYQRIEP